MAGIIDFLSDVIGSIVPKSIYDPHTGQLLGGALAGIGTALGAGPGLVAPQPTRRYLTTAYTATDPSGGGIPLPAAAYASYAPIGTPQQATGFTVGGAGTIMRYAIPGLAKYLPAIERVVPKVLAAAGLAETIYAIYAELRSRGMTHKTARKHAIIQAGGVPPRRRRMRVTNVHALRRAIRRVHGFRRVARKVGALGTRRGGKLMPWRRKHYARKGDLSPFLVEEYADMYDEAEDLDLDGDRFSDSAMGE